MRETPTDTLTLGVLMIHYQVVSDSPGAVQYTLALTYAKNCIIIFRSFLDNVVAPNFFGPPCTLAIMSRQNCMLATKFGL